MINLFIIIVHFSSTASGQRDFDGLVFEEAGLSTLCLLLFEPVLVAIESILIIAK